jgi:hypothetical protein
MGPREELRGSWKVRGEDGGEVHRTTVNGGQLWQWRCAWGGGGLNRAARLVMMTA